jgi:hypothetical protein
MAPTSIAAGATLTAGALNLAPSATDGTVLYSEPSASHSFTERHIVVGTGGVRVCLAGPLADTSGADCSGLDAGSFAASSAHNLVNRLSPNDGTIAGQGGIQIEQSLDVRQTYGTQVANAVATALAGLLT